MAIGNAVERDHFVYVYDEKYAGAQLNNDVQIQAQDTTGNWRTYHITNINNSQVVLAEMKSLKSRYPDCRVRAVDRTGRLIDLLE